MRRTGFAAMLILAWPSLCQADSDAETLARFKIIGAWAPHCDQPVSPANPMSIFAASGQEALALLRLDEVSSPITAGTVLGADILPPGLLRLRLSVPLSNGTEAEVESVTEMNEAGQIRVLSSTVYGTRTRILVSGGIRQETGSPMPWLTRCPEGQTS